MLNDIEKKIREIDFFIAHVRELPLFTMDLASLGYINASKILFGWGFVNILFIFEKGIEESCRDKKDDSLFMKFFAKHEIKTVKLVIKESEKSVIRVNNLIKDLARLKFNTSENDLIKKIKEIKSAYLKLAAVLGITRPIDLYYEQKKEFNLVEDIAKIRKEQGGLYPRLGKASDNLFIILSKKWNIDKDLLKFARADEIISCLLKGEKPELMELKTRYNFCILFCHNGKTFVVTGPKAKKIAQAVRDKNISNFKSDKIKGQSAYPGLVVGIVKIIKKEKDFKKLNKNNIIITPMTQVSYFPYLKKASAIITDEGGITCHAAIMSRELKIPCVIGTKIATKVLKDGDLVEVDANCGVVKILKQ